MKLMVTVLALALLVACSDEESSSGSAGAGGSTGGSAGAGASGGSAGSAGSGASAGSGGSAGATGGAGGSAGIAGSGGSPSSCVPRAGGWVTDLGDYAEPSAPSLPAAGATAVDPSFGTTILRVTDAGDGAGCVNAYSYWPSFNAASSRMFVACDGDPQLYDFDLANTAVTNKRALWAGTTPEGTTPSWEDAIWSSIEPDVLFAHDTTRLWRYDVVSQTYTLVKDFSAIVGSGHVRQMSKSSDDQVFGFTTQDSSWNVTGALAWRASDDATLTQLDQPGLDEVQIDKTGAYLVVKTGVSGTGAIEVRVVTLAGGTIEDLIDDAPDFSPGHSDNGAGVVIGADNWQNRVTFRQLATPHQVSSVLELGNDWTQDFHVSMLANDESRVTLSFYQTSAHTTGLFHNEIIQVATDGSKAVRRLAHHRSQHSDYWDSPRANVSRDGCLVTFTSNFGSTGRRDVYVLDLSK